MTPAAKRALMAMSGEWQFEGKATFDQSDALELCWLYGELCDGRARLKDGGDLCYSYRLTLAGLALQAKEREGGE